MDKQQASPQQIIDEMVRRIVAACRPLQVILFGSWARGNPGPDSDVDLLVVMPDGTAKRATALMLRRELAGVGLPKDIVVTTPQEISHRGNLVGSVLRPALREGKVLYDGG
jgi:predicted nucleotidyltransferase